MWWVSGRKMRGHRILWAGTRGGTPLRVSSGALGCFKDPEVLKQGGARQREINRKAVLQRLPTACGAAEKRPCQQHKSSPAVRRGVRTPKPAEPDASEERLLDAAGQLNESTTYSEEIIVKVDRRVETTQIKFDPLYFWDFSWLAQHYRVPWHIFDNFTDYVTVVGAIVTSLNLSCSL